MRHRIGDNDLCLTFNKSYLMEILLEIVTRQNTEQNCGFPLIKTTLKYVNTLDISINSCLARVRRIG